MATLLEFDWDEVNSRHLESRHGVTPSEVEEVFCQAPWFRMERAAHGLYQRYFVMGPTDAGRFLFVVYQKLARYVVRVVTAREMTSREKLAYRRHMRR